MGKDIILLGMGSTRVLCDYDAEVWTCNNAYKQMTVCMACQLERKKTIQYEVKEGKLVCPECGSVTPIPRVDKIFIAHKQCWDAQDDAVFNWNELNELIKRGVEIWNTHKVKGLNSRFLDINKLADYFGINYFSNVLAYMIAYAIRKYTRRKPDGLLALKEPLKLKLYGCDMQTFDEYGSEKGCMESWMMYGKAIGLEWEICEGGLMFKTKTGKPYGIETINTNKIAYMDKNGKKHYIKRNKGSTPDKINHEALNKICTPGKFGS